MVKINAITTVSHNGALVPFMHRHDLTVKKSAPTFDEGESVSCYIVRYDNERYAVFTASGVNNTKYHVFESLDELHEHFDEATV